MRMLVKQFFLTLLVLSLSSCSGGDDQNKEPTHKRQVKNPLEYQVKALEKAKAVDKKIQDAAKKQQQAIDEISSGTAKKDQDDNG